MKKFSTIEDQALDKLLRSSAPRCSDQRCDGFDADLTAAYVERSLSQAETARYESHLAACGSCRRVTTSLMRAVAADPQNAAKSVEKTSPGWIESLRGFFIAVSRPQAALAAAIVIALAATITFVVSKQDKQASSEQANVHTYSDSRTPNAQPQSQESQVASTADQYAQKAARSRANVKAESVDKEMDGLVAEAQPRKDEANEPQPAPPATTEPSKPAGESAPAKAEEAASKAEPEQPKSAAPQPAPEEKPLPRIDGKRSLPTDDTASKAETIKPGRADVEAKEGDKDKAAIRPDDSVTRRAEGPSSEKERRRIAAPPASARLRSASDEEKLNKKKGTPERQVAGKKFYLINEIWTDKDYKPEKEIPSVTVVRDSDLYKKLIAQHAKLKIYFERFAEEGAIIVYNSTVYKLSPPEK